MAITKQKKKEIVEKVGDIMKKGKTFVFLNFKGLKVNDIVSMRKDLRSKGIGYYVAKKTLLKRTLADGKFEGEMPELSGEIALAYAEDELSPAREIYSFEKKFKDAGMKMLGGIFGGAFMGREGMVGIATIPPMPVLRGQFVNIVSSPIQRLVIALNQIAETKTNA